MTTSEEIVPPPAVMWAQRATLLFVTINLEDCKEPTVKIESNKVFFEGVGGSDHKLHRVTINLYNKIDPLNSKSIVRERCIELVLIKDDDDASFWPKLTSDKEKQHWLKCDFNKWKDEDDSEDDLGGAGGGDFEEMMRQMGGLGGGGAGKPSLDDLDAGDADSDDEDLPDLE